MMRRDAFSNPLMHGFRMPPRSGTSENELFDLLWFNAQFFRTFSHALYVLAVAGVAVPVAPERAYFPVMPPEPGSYGAVDDGRGGHLVGGLGSEHSLSGKHGNCFSRSILCLETFVPRNPSNRRCLADRVDRDHLAHGQRPPPLQSVQLQFSTFREVDPASLYELLITLA